MGSYSSGRTELIQSSYDSREETLSLSGVAGIVGLIMSATWKEFKQMMAWVGGILSAFLRHEL